MASSIYATPPPDLNNEDTAPSDVSNNSSSAAVASSSSSVISRTTTTTTPTTTTTTKQQQQQQQQQRNKLNNECIGESLEASLQATTSSSSTSTLLTHSTLQQQHASLSPYFSASMKCSFLNNANRDDNSYNSSSAYINSNVQRNRTNANATDDSDCTTAMAAVAAAANAAMQLQLLEAINEVAQKRSQHSNPHDFPMDRNKTASMATTSLACNEPLGTDKSDSEKLSHKPYVDEEYGLSKIFLPKSFEQLSKAVGLIQPNQQQQVFPDNEHISTEVEAKTTTSSPTFSTVREGAEEEEEEEGQIKINRRIAYQIYCKECGENFDNEFKLNYHIMQEHNQKERVKNLTTSDSEQTESVQVKQELSESGTTTTNDVLSSYLANGKNQLPSSSTWLRASLSNLGFPFTATTVGGTYTPLLGLNSGGFANAEGLQRPALRIFNPEAFCELCNKEFCNKYFLKTHKANKHGIYDSTTTDLINSSPTNSLLAMNHLLQMQIQQQQHLEMEKSDVVRKSVETTSTTRQLLTSPAASAPIYCDICSKRFTNIFAMRRHRAKAHEQSPHHTYSSSSSTTEIKTDSYTPPLSLAANENKSNLMEDFRQDFLLEQEEVSFTPQPHKLSPNSQQQARESNFAYDKLKHLGVINPDAFCELCCKEYCNKYFLRTHKWKRHGIFVPPDDNENLNYPKLPVWPFMNMPLNLMTSGGDEKSVLSQRSQDNLEESVQPIKRIKLEIPDEDEEEWQRTAESENSTEKCKNLLGSENTEATVGLQNLQKLQSMIQQLTEFSSGGGKPSTTLNCHICGQGAENHYALQTHLITEHNAIARTQLPLQPLQQTMLKESPNGSPGNLVTPVGELRCTACNQEFITLSEFHKHIAEIHLLPVMGSEGFITPERPINTNAAAAVAAAVVANPRPPYSLTPTSSYCEICNKELCNKYFMKTHMQRMHGIEIENGAQIGGVVCNICNKELCSKYFLRVHKHNTHGIIEEGTPALPHPTRQNGLNLETQSSQTPITETDTVTHRSMSENPFGSGASLRLDSNSSQQEICPLCTKRFRSSKWLRSHLQNDHGSVGGDKLKEMNEDSENAAKTSSPILKTPNGATSSDSSTPAPSSSSQLAQALHNLNAQHFLNTTNQTLNSNQQQEQQTLKETPPPPPISRFKEYQCTMCSFTTPYYAFLFIHEKTHSITGNNDPNDPNYSKHNSNIVMQDQVEIENVNENNRKSKENNTNKTLPISSSSPNIMCTDYDKENENNVKVKSNESNMKAILNDTQPSAVIMNKEMKRSVAASPIQSLNQQFMEEVATKTGQIATYGVPKYHAHNNANEAPVQMQAFKVESVPESSDNNRFIPAIVYLPVRERLTGTVSITFKLTPA